MAVIPTYRPTNAGATGFGGGEQTLWDTDLTRQSMANQGALEQLKRQNENALGLQNNAAAIQQRKLQQFLPMFNQGGGGFGGAAGGQNSAMPAITVGGIYSPEQLQAQVNQSRSQGDQSAATQMRTNANQLAGRGMDAKSPLAMALNNQVQSANLASNAANETGLRFDAAGANSKQLLASEQARSNQANQWNQADIERRKQQAAQASQYMSLLAGLVG